METLTKVGDGGPRFNSSAEVQDYIVSTRELPERQELCGAERERPFLTA